MSGLPLEGVRILDLTRLLPGPLATRHLLEFGAEVLKIEGPAAQGQDDNTRAMWQTPAEAASGAPGLFFRELNDGKQLLRIDLRSEAGRAELIELVRGADALIEGFRPGVMAKLGLGFEVLHAANPRLVMCAISGYGQEGPWAQRAGHDINYIAMAGVLQQIAGPDGTPGLPNFQNADLLGGTQAAVSGLLAALLGAQRTGQGRFVDVSMTHEVWRHSVVARTALAATQRVAPPGRDLLSGGVPCYGVYRTRDDRHLAVGALELKFWQSVCEVVGRPQWGPRHHTLGLVVGGAEAMALRAELAALIAGQTLAHWQPLFDAADCCVTPVLRPDEARAHPLFAIKAGER
jgi:crotonobetainyl-CoA:carnitine CoA-transferase CaiB-like acyl-CoA transferase